ncbi:uncharacterized protein C8orf74 homolog [Myripristis murdjan]|uniref:uncharacterized protein C8orf74 homolog n=1 Tax=Myripristis murdjan TaxID=586833 RepID=UPI0011762BA1|nr:uncharacterized protein C8orf74 homolog [Myripristis murdjan]
MVSLTETEIIQIARLQREDGVQRLSAHFSWPEFSDERQSFHQEFVYDVTMFATARGFPWPDVIRAAGIAKDLFPKLDDLDASKLLSLLSNVLSECSPALAPIHRYALTQYLTETCVTRQRLLQAAVGGAANLSITRAHLEVQVPPKPCPLAQGTELSEWEHQRQQDQLASSLQQKEEQLKCLREVSKVALGEVNVPDHGRLDREGVLELVRVAARASGGQMQACLKEETSLVSELLQLKLQQAALATRRLHCPVPPNTPPPAPIQTHSRDGKVACSKTKRGAKKSGVQQASRPRL